MKFIAVLIALFLVQFQLPLAVNNVSAQSDFKDLLKNMDALKKELGDIGSDTQSEDSNYRELEERTQPRYATTEQVSVESEPHVTSEIEEVEEDIELRGNKVKRLKQLVADLRRENKILLEKCTECSSMQDQINSTSESLSDLHEQFGTLDLTVNDVSKSLQNIADEFGDFKTSVLASIQKTVENREKCQSGDGVGPHSAGPRPTYPTIVTVTFNPPFKKRPVVVYGLNVLDSYYNKNLRMSSKIVDLTNTYFKLQITDWADSVLYGAKFSWMACPS